MEPAQTPLRQFTRSLGSTSSFPPQLLPSGRLYDDPSLTERDATLSPSAQDDLRAVADLVSSPRTRPAQFSPKAVAALQAPLPVRSPMRHLSHQCQPPSPERLGTSPIPGFAQVKIMPYLSSSEVVIHYSAKVVILAVVRALLECVPRSQLTLSIGHSTGTIIKAMERLASQASPYTLRRDHSFVVIYRRALELVLDSPCPISNWDLWLEGHSRRHISSLLLGLSSGHPADLLASPSRTRKTKMPTS